MKYIVTFVKIFESTANISTNREVNSCSQYKYIYISSISTKRDILVVNMNVSIEVKTWKYKC